ncbi:MAG TPA: pyridoxamine 5'-phosphate oxidase family protein [Fimbriimonadaceae bacterium]|nr:pyridoxamine 5'-phosphate oxidase family protein [Fimbriimonadaceae bacterium]
MVATLAKAEMEALIREQIYARLGCHAKGMTYVVPISYACDAEKNRLVGQTTPGQKIDMMRENPEVCVEIDDVKSLTHWRSVILWGRFEELHGAEASKAMGLIIDRYEPLFAEAGEPNRRGREVTPPRLNHEPSVEVVYCIHISRMTGRCEDGVRTS